MDLKAEIVIGNRVMSRIWQYDTISIEQGGHYLSDSVSDGETGTKRLYERLVHKELCTRT